MAEGEELVRPQLSAAVKLTYDDFFTFPDDGKRHEIIDGEHHASPSPGTKHQTVSLNLLGVQEYWVVDPEIDAIKTYRRRIRETDRSGVRARRHHERATPARLVRAADRNLRITRALV